MSDLKVNSNKLSVSNKQNIKVEQNDKKEYFGHMIGGNQNGKQYTQDIKKESWRGHMV